MPQNLPTDEVLLNVTEGEPLTLPSAIGGTRTRYQWQKEQAGTWTTIPGATSASLQLAQVSLADQGLYRCEATNEWVTGLTLYSRPHRVAVEGEEQEPLPPSDPSADLDRNWTFERTYDLEGNIIGESKQFADALDRPTQTQTKNLAAKHVFATQTIYGSHGQPVLSTLAAPTNNQEFNYQERFVTAGGAALDYGPANFEGGKANQPDAVDETTPGTLGYYYSQNNTWEPATAATHNPFSLSEPSEGPLGGVRRVAGPGDEFRMGSGREAKGWEFPLLNDLDHYLTLRPQFVPGSTTVVSLRLRGEKAVSINVDGLESLTFTDADGKLLATCLSGPQYPALTLTAAIHADPTNGEGIPAYQDIHVPAAGPVALSVTGTGAIRIINLLTEAVASYTAPWPTITLTPGFYRVISERDNQALSYEAHYGDFSYSYYDDAGRVVATIAPKGVALALAAGNVPNSPSGLVGSWSFNEGSGPTTADASGSGYMGTLVNQAVWSASTAVPPSPAGGTSLVFGSGNDYVHVGDQPALRMSNKLTLEAWIYPTTNQDGIIINKENEYEVALTDGHIWWAFRNSQPGWNWVNTSLAVPLNTWTHIALTYDTGVVTAYMNGTQVGSPYSGAGPITYSGGEFWIGGRSESPQFFKGAIDEVRVWNTVHSPTDNSNSSGLQYVTRNTYSGAGTLVSTESPDEGKTEYVYARDGRLRFSQSARQRLENKFSYSNYDRAGRVVESGEYDAAAGNLVFQNELTEAPAVNSVLQPAVLEDRTPAGGLNPAGCRQRNYVLYDLPADDLPGSGRTQEFVLGAVARTSNGTSTTWYSYDELGQVTWLVQQVPGLEVKTVDYTYDGAGNVLEVAYQKGQPDAFYHHYLYDASQRLSRVYTSPDGLTKTQQAKYTYYLHGPLKRTELGSKLQGIDYVYTVQGWLKSINHATKSLDPGVDTPQRNGVYKDLFGLTLDYFSGDYRSGKLTAASPTIPNAPATRYDGTVRSAAWQTPASPDVRMHAYRYDAKAQLVQAGFGKLNSDVFEPAPNDGLEESLVTANDPQGAQAYDANGNIQRLRRRDLAGFATDDFSYQYTANTNQLSAVHNQAGAAVLDFDYDATGQMTRQRDEQGQTYLAYDVTGKVTGVYRDAQHQQPLATFTYDDRGFRASKASYDPATFQLKQTTTYVTDAQGTVLSIYEQAAGKTLERTEVPLYGSGQVGTLTRLADGTLDAHYELNDQLGNARVIFHKPQTLTYQATMEPGQAEREEAEFTNVAATRFAFAGVAYDGTHVARLNAAQGLRQGPGKTLTVEKGDTVTFSAAAFYQGTSGFAPQNLALVAGAVAAPPPAIAPAGARAEAGPARQSARLPQLSVGLAYTAVTSLQRERPTEGVLAWLRYRVLDKDGAVLDEQYEPVAATPATWQLVKTGVRVAQAGTLEVSVESDDMSRDVFFDQVRVEHTGGLIVQEQHQYAYGAPLPGLSYVVGGKVYRHGYQGQYAEADAETGYDSFELRMYASRIGRWTSYDPYGQYDSPYVGMGNNPVSGTDPDGGFCCGNALVPVSQSFGAGAVVTGTRATGAFARIGLQAASYTNAALSSVRSALVAGDNWVNYGGGEQMAQTFASMLPPIAAANVVSGVSSGTNIYGDAMSRTDIGLEAASLIPVGRVLKVAKPLLGVGTKLLSQGWVPNAGGNIVSFTTKEVSTFFRVYSGNPNGGAFLTKVAPASSAFAREGLALPSSNTASFIQRVTVPSGVTLQRSRALGAFGRRGGLEQFQISNFDSRVIFHPGSPLK